MSSFLIVLLFFRLIISLLFYSGTIYRNIFKEEDGNNTINENVWKFENRDYKLKFLRIFELF